MRPVPDASVVTFSSQEDAGSKSGELVESLGGRIYIRLPMTKTKTKTKTKKETIFGNQVGAGSNRGEVGES